MRWRASGRGVSSIRIKRRRMPSSWKNSKAAQGQLSNALSRLLVVVERYPELKSNQNFLGLQAQLEGTENRISVERNNFNGAVQDFNTAVRRFPTNMIAEYLAFLRVHSLPPNQARKGAQPSISISARQHLRLRPQQLRPRLRKVDRPLRRTMLDMAPKAHYFWHRAKDCSIHRVLVRITFVLATMSSYAAEVIPPKPAALPSTIMPGWFQKMPRFVSTNSSPNSNERHPTKSWSRSFPKCRATRRLRITRNASLRRGRWTKEQRNGVCALRLPARPEDVHSGRLRLGRRAFRI